MKTKILVGLLVIGILFSSGCVQEELNEEGAADGEKKDCPYECCVDDAAYKIRSCPEGYKCKENKCFEPGKEKPPEEKEEIKSLFIPDVTHFGDLIIDGTKTMVIEDTNYFQQGNVYIKDSAKLIIRNSKFMHGRGRVPTVHVNIFVEDSGSLEIENSTIFPEEQPGIATFAIVSVKENAKVNMTNSPTEIHALSISNNAELTMTDSEMIYHAGGLLQISGGDIRLVNSTIGAIGLTVPEGAHMDISGLKSGVCFESWDIHEMIPDVDYNVIMEDSCILKDFEGKFEHGPFERGWQFFLNPKSHVRISDSELRKVAIDLVNENVKFENLKMDAPSSLKYRDIELKNITMTGQWPFTITDSNVTISNSDYLFIQPFGQSTVTLINSHLVEFIPRNFFGTMIFENSLWTEAGEIIGGKEYHSMENDFTMKGSLKIEKVRENIGWQDAQVTREYNVIVTNREGDPIPDALIKINKESVKTDIAGKAKFNIIFNEFNYNKPQILEIIKDGKTIVEKEIDFFTETPIIIN